MHDLLNALHTGWEAFWAIPHIRIYLIVGWLAYLIWLGGWIILQKRDPVATISWLLSLALLPYIGFLIYYLFGPQKIARHRLRRARRRVDLGGIDDESRNPEYAETQRAVLATTGFPPSSATRLELLIDGSHKYPRLLQDIAAATREIHVEYYIYDPDRHGGARCPGRSSAARRQGAHVAGCDGLEEILAPVLSTFVGCRR